MPLNPLPAPGGSTSGLVTNRLSQSSSHTGLTRCTNLVEGLLLQSDVSEGVTVLLFLSIVHQKRQGQTSAQAACWRFRCRKAPAVLPFLLINCKHAHFFIASSSFILPIFDSCLLSELSITETPSNLLFYSIPFSWS